MFCKKCGGQIVEGVAFCKHCGTPVNVERSAMLKPETASKKYRLVGIFAVGIVILIVILATAGIVTKVNGKGYEKVLQKYVKAIEQEDGELLYSLYAPAYVDWLVGPGSFYSETEYLISDYQEECKEHHEYLSNGIEKHPPIQYDIESAEKLNAEDLESLNRMLTRDYDFDENSVRQCYLVSCRIYIPGGNHSLTGERYIMKIRGKWYMGRGI